MYKWSLPIVGEETPGNFQFAYLALPERFITKEEYQRMVKVIELFEAGLVLERLEQQEERVTLPVFWNFARGD